MRINSHAHLFPFRSAFTEETAALLFDRLTRENWPDFAVKAAAKVVTRAISGEMLDEEALLGELVETLKADSTLDTLIKAGAIKAQPAVSLALSGDTAGLPAGALREIIGKVGAALQKSDDSDARTVDLGDLVAFLGIGLKPSVREIAERLMEFGGDDSAAIALTLDVTRGGKADDALFQGQLRETSLAALVFPGRLFPFVAVNPARGLHFERMTGAIETLGYVGVSLYPALGYEVDDKRLSRVLAWCEAEDVPLIVHCEDGGFCRDRESLKFADPAPWSALLQRHPRLRVSFAHFGGVENLVKACIPAESWTATIIELMRQYPGVYADLAHHDSCLDGAEREANYFANLALLLDDPVIRERILFGTGFYLARQRVRDDNLWRFFETRLSGPHFQQITSANPERFLGLPTPEGKSRPNIERHLRFLAKHNQQVTRLPAEWVTRALATELEPVTFYPNPFGTTWTRNNEAHFYTEQYLRNLMSTDLAGRLTFTEKGQLRMRDLERWPSEALPKPIREKALTSLATGLQTFLTQAPTPGAIPEGNTSSGAARKVLLSIFQNPDAQVAAFGPAVDRLYHFRSEA